MKRAYFDETDVLTQMEDIGELANKIEEAQKANDVLESMPLLVEIADLVEDLSGKKVDVPKAEPPQNLNQVIELEDRNGLPEGKPRVTTSEFYSVKEKGTSRQKLNNRAVDLLKIFNEDPDRKPTAKEKAVLAKFSGYGGGLIDKATGKKGSAYEYYTPKPVAEEIWECMKDIGYNGGKMLDPCAGTGIFGATAPLNSVVDSVELSQESGRVNQLINDGPGYKTTISCFEKVAASTPDNVYDAVVTNVPFGDNAARGGNQFHDQRYQQEPLEVYFILRSLEKLRAGGLGAFIVPMRCVSGRGGTEERLRYRACLIAEFIGAYRLPTGTFSSADTETATDVVFFRKYNDETRTKIEELQEQNPELLKESKILWDMFIDGKYFTTAEGKRYILGEFQPADPKKFRDVDKYIFGGNLSQLREIIRERRLPKSRINWELLEATETEPIIYHEGDTICQAGCTLVMRGGVWVELPKVKADYELAELVEKMTDPYEAFENKVTFDDANKVVDYLWRTDNTAKLPGWVKAALSIIEKKVAVNDRSDIWDKGLIALSVRQVINEHSNQTGFDYKDQFAALSKALERAKIAKKDSKIGGEIGTALGVALNHYTKKNGFSDFWLGNVEEEITKTQAVFEALNTPEAKVANLRYQSKSSWIDADKVKDTLGNDFDPITDSNWCLSHDGKKVINADDYYVGSYGAFLKKIDEDIAACKDETIKAKLIRQKTDAADRVNTIDVDRMKFDLRCPNTLVDPWEKVKFLKQFVSPYARVQTADGKTWADVEVHVVKDTPDTERIKNRIGDYIKNGTITLGGMTFWEKDTPLADKHRIAHEMITELKRQIEEANTHFNSWVHSNNLIMERLKKMAKDPDKLRFKAMEDESEIQIPGMNPELKLHGFQSAYVRQMGREFGGINGFGVGLGKTFTALAAVQHVQAIGVKKKTMFVVPNSVLANWRQETSKAYSSIEDCLFVGLRVDRKGKATVKSNAYDEDLWKVTENKHAKIFLTMEAFAKIRVKTETINDYADHMREVDKSFSETTDTKEDEKHKSALAKIMTEFEKESNTAPYLEEMGIDSIVIDEAHAYKNASSVIDFKGGKYLSLSPASKRGIDAMLKTWYIRGQSPLGDGVLMLTATPITNSPLEIYSMLSLACGHKKVNDSVLGCQGADDFLETTCTLLPQDGFQLDGTPKMVNTFIGLKNVELLRNAISNTTVVKNAADVGAKVVIPERLELTTGVTLDGKSLDELNLYKLAYRYATEFKKQQERRGGVNQQVLDDPNYKKAYEFVQSQTNEPVEIIGHPFNLIQKMTAIIADPELAQKATFYKVSSDQKETADKVIAAFNKLNIKENRSYKNPWTQDKAELSKKEILDEESGEKETKTVTQVLAQYVKGSDDIDKVVIDTVDPLSITKFENIAEKENLQLNVTCSPKLAAFIENFKKEMATPRGMVSDSETSKIVKQLVFCDLLGLHNKIKRLLATKAGVSSGKITYVTGKVNNDPEKLLEVSDGYNAQGDENKYQVIIANEKAEVGINLQKGTQAIHHLTIGWTPDSLEQRNGRGARQGNKTQTVTIYYYDADGTFDAVKRTMVNHKAGWIDQVLDAKGGSTVNIKGGFSREEQEALIESVGDPDAVRKMQELKEAKERQARIDNTRQSQMSLLSMVEKQSNFLKRNEKLEWKVRDTMLDAFRVTQEIKKTQTELGKAQKLRDNYQQGSEFYERADRKVTRLNEKIAQFEKTLQGYYDYLDSSSSFETKEYEPDENGRWGYQTKHFDAKGYLEDFLKGYKPKEDSLAFHLNHATKVKDSGKLYTDWRTSVEQAQAMKNQAEKDFNDFQDQEGHYPDSILKALQNGDCKILAGVPVIGLSFYRHTGNLLVVDGIDMSSRRIRGYGIVNNAVYGEYVNESSIRELDFIYPNDPKYQNCLKEAADIEDQAAEHGSTAHKYSELLPSVTQYRRNANLVSYDVDDYELPQPYFPLVITPKQAEASQLCKRIFDSQKGIVKGVEKRRGYDYVVVTADTELVRRRNYIRDSDKIEMLKDYALAHNLKAKISEFGRNGLGFYYFSLSDFTDNVDDFRASLNTPVNGKTIEQQASDWLKENIKWIEFDEDPIKAFRLERAIEEIKYNRARNRVA